MEVCENYKTQCLIPQTFILSMGFGVRVVEDGDLKQCTWDFQMATKMRKIFNIFTSQQTWYVGVVEDGE